MEPSGGGNKGGETRSAKVVPISSLRPGSRDVCAVFIVLEKGACRGGVTGRCARPFGTLTGVVLAAACATSRPSGIIDQAGQCCAPVHYC